MMKLDSFFSKLRRKRGITGTDVAVAITVISFAVGVVTAIYVNSINKSKDNIRYANAVRIATNVIENIQKKPYEYIVSLCGDDNKKEWNGGSTVKPFDTNIPKGFYLEVTATKPAGNIDIARDIVVNVKYKASKTYKTITLSTLKEKDIIDMVNPPDFSLIDTYKLNSSDKFYYPLKNNGSGDSPKWIVTSVEDIDWYDYSKKKFAVVGETSSQLNFGSEFSDTNGRILVWIPRFAYKENSPVEYLYGSSNYLISLNETKSGTNSLFSYGVKYENDISESSKPVSFSSGYTNAFEGETDGKNVSGIWYENGKKDSNGYELAKKLKDNINSLDGELNVNIPD